VNYNFQTDESHFTRAFEKVQSGCDFSCYCRFPFDVKGLNLYYWKYYPRERGTYHFLNADVILGNVNSLLQLLKELVRAYGQPLVERSIQGTSEDVDAFHRFYIDLF